MLYKIVRSYANKNRRQTIRIGLYLEEAQAHCHDPETSSKTCTGKTGLACTRRNGSWFDGYVSE